jgi:hypothetical protein
VVTDDAIAAGAMSPTRLTIVCRDGRRIERFLEFMEGSPEQPMTHDEAITKFSTCLQTGLGAAPAVINTLADQILDLDNCEDVADIVADFPAASQS